MSTRTKKLPPGHWGFQLREERKQLAWPILRSDKCSPLFRTAALLEIARAHYWRAWEDFYDLPAKQRGTILMQHPFDFDTYTDHWLYAGRTAFYVRETAAAMLDWWGRSPKESPFLADGQTSYAVPDGYYNR